MSRTDDIVQFVRDRLGAARPSQQRGPLDDALLFSSHERALKANESALSQVQSAGATAAQQRSVLDAATDHARLLLARGPDVRGSLSQLRDALERSKLLSLNAGLEGARIGEAAGKAVAAMAEEVRELSARGLAALEEHLSLLTQLDRDRDRLREQLEEARGRATALADELLKAQAAQREAASALTELGNQIKRASASDPELARAASEAAEHARGLVAALSTLSSRPRRNLVLRALRPTIRPLARLLKEIEQSAAGDDDG